MIPRDRILLLIGGAVVLALAWIVAVYVLAATAGAGLRDDIATAHRVQELGDQLLIEVHGQHEELGEYLMSRDPTALGRYWQAVFAEAGITRQIRGAVAGLAGITEALAEVTTENAGWRATVASPAIVAVGSGSSGALESAIRARLQDQTRRHTAANDFVRQIDVVETELGTRVDELQRVRIQATGAGLAVELVAACLALLYVRRYGLRISRELQRRTEASAERFAILASLRTLRTQQTPEATAAAIAGALLGLPGVDGAAVVEFADDRVVVLALVGVPGLPIETDEALADAQARYLRERAATGPWAIPFLRSATAWPPVDQTGLAGVRSIAFAPIQVDGQLIALISIATTDEALGRRFVEELPAVGEFASVAEAILAPALIARREREAARRRIAAIIAARAFGPVFQPIVELSTGTTVGFEALTRFDDGSSPDQVLAEAARCGMGIELETVTLEAAVQEARSLAQGTWLSLNVSPAMLAEVDSLRRLLADRTDARVLEITEHQKIEAYGPLRAAMLQLGPGVRLAVDDTGAGVANFNHLVELRPHFVKIDIGLVRGVDADPSRRAVVVGLVHFAAEAGCEVIAEGIETDAERATVAELGVRLGQGYLLARPAPAAAWCLATPGGPMSGISRSPGRLAARQRHQRNRLELQRAPRPDQLEGLAGPTWGMSPMRGSDPAREDPGADTRTVATGPVITRPWLPH